MVLNSLDEEVSDIKRKQHEKDGDLLYSTTYWTAPLERDQKFSSCMRLWVAHP